MNDETKKRLEEIIGMPTIVEALVDYGRKQGRKEKKGLAIWTFAAGAGIAALSAVIYETIFAPPRVTHFSEKRVNDIGVWEDDENENEEEKREEN